jgi:imidazolonepropionase-like amidohydrolase
MRPSRIIVGATVLTLLAQSFTWAEQAPGPTTSIVIRAGRLLNGTTAAPVENAVIVVVGDRIEAVGPAASVSLPPNAQTIDLSGETVLPGLINGHDHPTIRAFAGRELAREGRNSLLQQLEEMAEPLVMQAARGVRNLRADLLGGVTSEYVVGEVEFNDVYLKKMVDTGVIPGPRIYPSGPWLIATAGYDPIPATNTPWGIRSFIRTSVERGAHHIKILVSRSMISGPSFGRSFGEGATNFTKEEIEAAVDEAHRLGVKVTAHAGDPASIKLALEAGADSIQHASSLTADVLALFQKRGAGIVNTYVTGLQSYFTPKDFAYLDTQAKSAEDWISYGRGLLERTIAANPRSGAGGRTMRDRLTERYAELKAAKDRGIPIAVGTDNMQALLHLEIEHLVAAGFTPLEAISAATGTGARALGIGDEVGTLEKGKYADIIAVRGRPDENIRDLAKVTFVMVGGRTFTGLTYR